MERTELMNITIHSHTAAAPEREGGATGKSRLQSVKHRENETSGRVEQWETAGNERGRRRKGERKASRQGQEERMR